MAIRILPVEQFQMLDWLLNEVHKQLELIVPICLCIIQTKADLASICIVLGEVLEWEKQSYILSGIITPEICG